MNKLSDVVDNEVAKSTKFNILKTKANNLEKKILDATTLIHINQYKTDKQNLEKKTEYVDIKILDASGLVTTTLLNTKISEVENNISVTTTVLNTKISEAEKKILNHAKYITTQKFKMLTAANFTARLKQANLVSKIDFDNKLISFNRKITWNKTKYLEVQKNLNSLITKDYIFFLGRNFFTSNDRSQNTFVYQPILDSLELKKR